VSVALSRLSVILKSVAQGMSPLNIAVVVVKAVSLSHKQHGGHSSLMGTRLSFWLRLKGSRSCVALCIPKVGIRAVAITA